MKSEREGQTPSGVYSYWWFNLIHTRYFLKTRIFVTSDFSYFSAPRMGSTVVHCVPALRQAACETLDSDELMRCVSGAFQIKHHIMLPVLF